MKDVEIEGSRMYQMAERLFPICRSLANEGFVESLNELCKSVPFKVKKVPTGTKVFDWTVPKEWNIREAYIMNDLGEKIVDMKNNNLHVVGYSTPINKTMSLEELQEHIYSIEDMPNAIPYITSYYKERWGFCITHDQREKLKQGEYQVYIDSDLKEGHLTYGELIIPGESEKEIFLSTYLCHPSMANNELSGPVLMVELAKWIMKQPRKYTYRMIIVPETIGSITYLSKNLLGMKANVIAGFNLTCVGDDRMYSYLPSKYGNTYADKVALNVLNHMDIDVRKFSFLDRGSDERQYCSTGIDLPVVSIMRSKYGEYPEYHTSLDNMDLISAKGLQGSFDIHKACLELIEENEVYTIDCLCEPQLGKRGLYPTLSTRESGAVVKNMMNFIAYADGTNDIIDISNIIGVSADQLFPIIHQLKEKSLIKDNSEDYKIRKIK